MGIICIIIGGAFVCCSIYAILFVRKAKDFPGVMAEVELSKVELVRTGGNSRSKQHKLIFSYTVDGKNYSESPHIYAYNQFSVEKQAAKYPVGSQHIVFYNTENPKQIMLKKNISLPGLVVLFLIGAGLILTGLYCLGLISVNFPERFF